MLSIMENEDELACLLGHELAHRLLRMHDSFLGLDLFFGKVWKPTEPEVEADRLGCWMAHRAGYNPFALGELLSRIGGHPDFKSAPPEKDKHPPILERAKWSHEFAKENAWSASTIAQKDQFRRFISMQFSKEKLDSSSASKLDEIIRNSKNHGQGSRKHRFKRYLENTKQLSELIQNNADLRAALKPMRSAREPGEMFLSGTLKIDRPEWLDDDHLLLAKLWESIKQLTELLLSVTPFVGDFIDLYEMIEGKSFFDGSPLSTTQRILAGAGIIVGSRRIFEGAGRVAKGIKEDLKLEGETARILNKSEDVGKAIERLGWKGTKEAVDDLREIVPILKNTGKLPVNYISKKEASRLGWKPEAGNLHEVAPGKQIGGGRHWNEEGHLPDGNILKQMLAIEMDFEEKNESYIAKMENEFI